MNTFETKAIEENGGTYKKINPTTKVYTDGTIAVYNFEKEEWDDAVIKKGQFKYYDINKKINVLERVERIVARLFLPNPYDYTILEFKNKMEKYRYSVDNLEWFASQQKFRGVGYFFRKDKYEVHIYDNKTRKTIYGGRYNTTEEAQAKVAELREKLNKNINLKN